MTDTTRSEEPTKESQLHLNTAEQLPVTAESLLKLWQPKLQEWAEQGYLLKAAAQALGINHQQPPAQLTRLVERLTQGKTGDLPSLELLQQQVMPNAAGAYAISKRTIYLNNDWVQTASELDTIRVLTEEFGHHLDGLLNCEDSHGDEGEIFAELLTGLNNPHVSDKLDRGQIEVKGEVIDVEFSQTDLKYGWLLVGDEINGEGKQDKAGISVSLSSNGKVLAVGAAHADEDDSNGNSLANNGSITFWKEENGKWNQLGNPHKIVGEKTNIYRGWSVSLSNNGLTASVANRLGDGKDDDGNTALKAGTVRVVKYDESINQWIEFGNVVVGSVADGQIETARLSGDGNSLIIGSPQKQGGYVQVYKYNGDSDGSGKWKLKGEKITAEAGKDFFGFAADISDDGKSLPSEHMAETNQPFTKAEQEQPRK